MKTIKLSLLLFSSLLMSITTIAQSVKPQGVCYTDEHFTEMSQQDPSMLQQREDLEKYIANFKATYNPSTDKPTTIIIPVVVHNITHDGGIGYVSKATIDAQIVRLNKDYQGINADLNSVRPIFSPYTAALNIEFRLAHIDPNGNCTEGIVRMESPYSYNTAVNDNVKAVSYWDSHKYFNIWVIDAIQDNGNGSYVAGFAQFPTGFGGGINNTYGVVVVNQNFSGSDRTLTHEVGHALSLYHTFQGNCGSNCSSSGDYCCDTPPTSNGGFDCSVANTCSNDANGPDPYNANVDDQFENYMSYSQCTYMFTLDQEARMMAILNLTSTNNGLAQLYTTTNLNNTGVADTYTPAECKPNVLFSANKKFICEGASVNYTDNSWGSVANAWNWSFTGGSPSSSSVYSPTITYNTAGTFNTTLTASNAGGYNSKTENNIVTVSSLTADYAGPVLDGFENTTTFNNDWRIESDNGEAWQNSTAAAATGSRAMRLRNYNTTVYREYDSLISPSYNLSVMQNPTFSFKVAYKRKNTSSNDRLFVYYSTDCGNSWTLQTLFSPTSMKTSPDQSSYFTPSNSAHWLTKTVNITPVATETNVRFMFAFRADDGNNIYLDDLNINGTVGIDSYSKIGNFNVFPNPATSNAQVSFNLIKSVDNLTIQVRNAVGQIVTKVISGQAFSAGSYNLKIDESRKLSKGIYFVEFNADDVVKVQKLIIQ